ncbi:glycoside hydrolase family 71/99-like protein [Aquimarina rhabdastrellae]
MKNNVLNLQIVVLFLLIVCYSCTKEEVNEVQLTKNELNVEEQQEERYSDQELDSILEIEIDNLYTKTYKKPNAKRVPKTNAKKVYVHYMPWFQSKDYDGEWGMHWTMANQNPDIIENGKRQIASYYYPKVGPYSSNDPQLQEYHLLLMKMAGVDGVIFDWYGSRDINDYAAIKNSTESFISKIEETDLEFSIMYEDRVVQFSTEQKASAEAIQIIKDDFEYVENNYFISPNYQKINGKNVLSIFGPENVTSPESWSDILTTFDTSPAILTLWGATERVGGLNAGEYSWVDKGHLNTQQAYYDYVVANCASIKFVELDIAVGAVYPGFNAFYDEGGWGDQVDNLNWEIEHENAFTETLSFMDDRPCVDFVQVITWNDFGEGTMIEPTKEFGYRYINKLSKYTGVETSRSLRRLPESLYKLRKKYPHNELIQLLLNRVHDYMLDMNYRRSRMLIRAIERFGNFL